MKIPAANQDTRTSETRTNDQFEKDATREKSSEQSRFSQVMKRKKDDEAEAGVKPDSTSEKDKPFEPDRTRPGKSDEAENLKDQLPADPASQQQLAPTAGDTPKPLEQVEVFRGRTEAARPTGATLASEIVQEIRMVSPSGAPPAIEIQFNSKTLDGLRVQVGSVDGQLNIQFLPKTEQTAQLLSENVASLNQALVDRGYKVAAIAVQPASSSGQSSTSPDRGRQGGGFGRRVERDPRGGGRR